MLICFGFCVGLLCRRCNMTDIIYGFDIDATIFDSSHRAKYLKNGELDLEDWKSHSLELILEDEPLALLRFMKHLLNSGAEVFICTSRNKCPSIIQLLEKWDINCKVIISRALDDHRPDAEYKKSRIGNAYREAIQKGEEIVFFDDREDIRLALTEIGVKCYDPRIYNGKENGNLRYLF